MTNELSQWTDKSVQDFQQINACLEAVKGSPIYKKHGPEGTWQVLAMAKTLNINPLQALNRDLYCIKGKIEMTAQCMNNLIRRHGHSVTKDPKSTTTCCILHGKRADNGDTWTVSYSLKDAQEAGLTSNPAWKKFTTDMCFNRALSRLARQLFPDVIAGCYIEGEIRDAPPIDAPIPEPDKTITEDQVNLLDATIINDLFPAEATDKIKSILQIEDISNVPASRYDSLMSWLSKRQHEQEAENIEVLEDHEESTTSEELL